jgi:hypothetical protein
MDLLILSFISFIIGYYYSDYVNQARRQELLEAGNRIFEQTSYAVLANLNKMHDNGLKALELVCEKCTEEDQTKQEEYAKIAEVFDRKMDEFGEEYLKFLKSSVSHKIKYNTYKQVKENFEHLINNNSEDNKNA